MRAGPLLGVLLCSGTLLAAGPAPQAGRPKTERRAPNLGTGMGNAYLREARPVLAAHAFRQQIAVDPDAVAAHVGLGRSLARQGRCTDAMAELAPYEDTTPFGAEVALTAALCSSRLGYLDDALYYDRLAVEIDPDNARAWTNLALDLHEAGDLTGAEEALNRLVVIGREGRDGSLYARAVLALRAGRIEEMDLLLQLWGREDRSNGELRRLLAQSWLDMDDPVAALAVLDSRRRLKRSYQENWLRAEAMRRQGDPAAALHWVDASRLHPFQGSSVDAVRVRALVDLDKLAEASKLAAELTDLADPETVASRWYLARARGDAADMETSAREYAASQPNPLRKLENLVPWNRR